jgi:hypothetical protein
MGFAVGIPETLVKIRPVGWTVQALLAARVATVDQAPMVGYGIALAAYGIVWLPTAILAFAASNAHWTFPLPCLIPQFNQQ